MFIKCAVRIPIIKSVSTFLRSISIPYRPLFFYILSRIFRIIRCRKISMQFSKISTIVACTLKHVTDTLCIFTQGTDGAIRITIQRYTTLVRIHSCQQTATMRATQRTITLCWSQYHWFAGKSIQIRCMHGIGFKIHLFPESLLSPKFHRLIAILIRKNINDIGMFDLFSLWSFTPLHSKQTQTAE